MIMKIGLLPSILLTDVQIAIADYQVCLNFSSAVKSRGDEIQVTHVHEQYRLLNWPQTLTDYRKWGQFNKHT